MTIVLETGARDALADALDTDIGSAGYLEFQTGAQVEVATITFGNPAFGPASTGVITMTGQPLEDTNATGNAGAVDAFQIFASGAVLILSGSVSTAAADINMSSLTVAATDTVELTTFTIDVPA